MSSDRQLANVLTKGLASITFQAIIGKLGMDKYLFASLRGTVRNLNFPIWGFLYILM